MSISTSADVAPLERICVKIPVAVQLTGLSRSRIYELLKKGEIEYIKVGSSTLIPVDSLKRFIEGKRADRQPPMD